MKIRLRRKALLLHILAGCWLVFLLAACGSATTTGSGNPTSTVTSAPTLTSPPAKLVLTFECKGAFNPSSTHEKVCVHTLPGASLTIKVTYCKGNVDQSTALKGTFTADKTGYYGWSWTPQATCRGHWFLERDSRGDDHTWWAEPHEQCFLYGLICLRLDGFSSRRVIGIGSTRG